MSMLQNVLNQIINLRGIDITIKEMSTGTIHSLKAVQSNYFRAPIVDENVTASARQYVISQTNLTFKPRRGDSFRISGTEYYSIDDVEEMYGLGANLGYRITLA